MDHTIKARLNAVRKQNYPLTLTDDDAEALVECIRHIMAVVRENDQVLVMEDYDLATSTLVHPTRRPATASGRRKNRSRQ